ncbi:unnamed protein product [Rodentolepis nana]|uniref:Uncharacterized protein n=1 Tax=Rodentolepis nana TaxID=102285 RepID=A0A3P7S7E8_RODNA|nr:unnamed protein product [Rodentolepis nana]
MNRVAPHTVQRLRFDLPTRVFGPQWFRRFGFLPIKVSTQMDKDGVVHGIDTSTEMVRFSRTLASFQHELLQCNYARPSISLLDHQTSNIFMIGEVVVDLALCYIVLHVLRHLNFHNLCEKWAEYTSIESKFTRSMSSQ